MRFKERRTRLTGPVGMKRVEVGSQPPGVVVQEAAGGGQGCTSLMSGCG